MWLLTSGSATADPRNDQAHRDSKGAKVKAAYLYWTILGGDTAGSSFKKGLFKGRAITGTTIGSGGTPC